MVTVEAVDTVCTSPGVVPSVVVSFETEFSVSDVDGSETDTIPVRIHVYSPQLILTVTFSRSAVCLIRKYMIYISKKYSLLESGISLCIFSTHLGQALLSKDTVFCLESHIVM